MTRQQVLKNAKSIISARKRDAEAKAEANYALALQDISFRTNETNIANATMEIAKLEMQNKDTSSETELLKTFNKERTKILKKLGFTLRDIEPQYFCKKCNDTGVFNNNVCKCLEVEINNILMKDISCAVDKSHTFENCKESFLKENNLDKIYKTTFDWVNKYPSSKYKNIILLGKAGAGKTYLTDCIANGLIKKQEFVNFVTAFNLNNSMLNYHTTFDDSKNSILEPFLTCPVLIIDDLGTEPILKNITKEYLYLIVNERIINGKCTIISSNLTPNEIIDRYGERIYSRLFNKTNCLSFNFQNADLRLK